MSEAESSRLAAIHVLVFQFGGVAGAIRRIVHGWPGRFSRVQISIALQRRCPLLVPNQHQVSDCIERLEKQRVIECVAFKHSKIYHKTQFSKAPAIARRPSWKGRRNNMKFIAEQFPLPLEDPALAFELKLRDQWAANQSADAHNWTDEAMAMCWYLGQSNWDLWHSVPNYVREQIVCAYQFEQSALQWNGRKTIRTYREACPPVDKSVMEAHRERVESMAQQLSADWSANRPPSVFTYDTSIAAGVSARLGRRVEAIKKSEQMHEVYP